MPFRAKRNCRNSEEAVQYALRHGAGCRYGLDELNQFTRGGGLIFEQAMFELGYRRHKKDKNRWVRFKSESERQEARKTVLEEWQRARDALTTLVQGEELEKLSGLMVSPNGRFEYDKTYSLRAGERGMIFVSLNFNPMYSGPAEGLDSYYGPRVGNKAHIYGQQHGFRIDARNVRLGKQNSIHIKAVRQDLTYAECVWPTLVRSEKLFDLADDLVSRIIAHV